MRPNFKNSILNVSASISRFLGNLTDISTIKILDKALNIDYKNIVYICFDGLGMYPLKQNLDKSSFLRKHVKKTITSVFPSTTTNATSSLCSGLYPMDHGMFGWSLYIEQLQQCVDLFPLTNSYTGEEIKDKDLIRKMFYYEYYFDKAKDTPYNTTGIFPPYVNHVKNNKAYKTNDEMFNIIDKTCKQEGKQFIYCYFGEPDSTMHRFGVNSKQAKKIISYIDEKIQQLYKNNPQTLFIITPDHGQTDITDYIELYKDTELLKTLKTPLYLEARAVSFNLLDGKDKDFKKQMKKYKNIKLYKVEKLIKSNYFGKPTHNAKLLGDYIGVVKDNKTQLLLSPKMVKFKGHHTGLSKREMLLPLIIIG